MICLTIPWPWSQTHLPPAVQLQPGEWNGAPSAQSCNQSLRADSHWLAWSHALLQTNCCGQGEGHAAVMCRVGVAPRQGAVEGLSWAGLQRQR